MIPYLEKIDTDKYMIGWDNIDVDDFHGLLVVLFRVRLFMLSEV